MSTGEAIRKSFMYDLFAGRGGASAAFRAAGWDVVTVDNDPKFRCTFTLDLREWTPTTGPARPEFVWASVPCTEFSREDMPWCRTGQAPSLDLYFAALRAIQALRPRWWAIEITRGAQYHIGRAPLILGKHYLWGWFPKIQKFDVPGTKERRSSSADALRSEIPRPISEAFLRAIVGARKEAA